MPHMRILLRSLCCFAALACTADSGDTGKRGDAGPGGKDGVDGVDGRDAAKGVPGAAGTSCTVTDQDDGTKSIACDDGTTATVSDGADGSDGDAGADGESCTVTANANGTKTISCDDGTEAIVADGLRSLVAVVAESPGANCPTGGQRVNTGLDDDRDGDLDSGEIDSSAYICKHSCSGTLNKLFHELPTSETATLDLGQVAIQGAPGAVKILEFNGLGVVGGSSDNLLDGTESLTFVFDGLAIDLSYAVISSGNENGNGTYGDSVIEAFGADGASLGSVMPTENTGTKDISAAFGGAPISSFTLTAAGDGIRLEKMNFLHCL